MKKFSRVAKSLAAVLVAAGLLAGTTAPVMASTNAGSYTLRIVDDTGWG